MKPKKIIGGTVGMGLPKPDLRQTDPRKGDYVRGKEEIAKIVDDYLKENTVEAVETFVVTAVKDTELNETRIDRTNAEIFAAYKGGKNVICVLNYDGTAFVLHPVSICEDFTVFTTLMMNESICVMLNNGDLTITEMEFSNTEDLNTAVNTALEQAKESGLFDGKPGADGKDGKDGQDGQNGRDGVDGKTPIKGTDYFTPADVQEIAEQAAELVDIPAGGGGGWILLDPVELTEESAHIELYAEDEDGNPIAFDEVVFCAALKINDESNNGLYNSIYLRPNPGTTDGRLEFRINSIIPKDKTHTGYLFGTIRCCGAWIADLHSYQYTTYRMAQQEVGQYERMFDGEYAGDIKSISLSNIYGTPYGIGTKFVVAVRPKR